MEGWSTSGLEESLGGREGVAKGDENVHVTKLIMRGVSANWIKEK